MLCFRGMTQEGPLRRHWMLMVGFKALQFYRDSDSIIVLDGGSALIAHTVAGSNLRAATRAVC